MHALACPNCGIGLSSSYHDDAQDAQRRIAELESQVRILTGKATAAVPFRAGSENETKLDTQLLIMGIFQLIVDKLADYEDELRQLKSSQSTTPNQNSNNLELPSPTGPNDPSAARSATPTANGGNPNNSRHSLLSSFLTTRKSVSNLQSSAAGAGGAASPSTHDLQAALTREQTLRERAEGQLSQANGELEELSAQLFQQANEMVATERKARAKLEERVEVLERRDGEKRKRLERLEGAVKRIERVRGLLSAP
ncbi:MAG: hypothetical protein M4579_002489 [Chaenotheca gracillima]|nr:MAG: hypothetical protein M4579_002489 [Chaenotheca gracillima]